MSAGGQRIVELKGLIIGYVSLLVIMIVSVNTKKGKM